MGSDVAVEESTELTTIEQKEFTQLESTIEKHLSAFYEVGFALMQIRDNRYYRETHSTFEQYCKERWGFTKSRANQLISASEVADNLTTTVAISERTVRPLTHIKDPEEQREVFQKAVETAPEGKVTAKHIEKTVQEYKYTDTYPVSDAMAFAGMAISQLERIRTDDPKREEAIQKVKFTVKGIEKTIQARRPKLENYHAPRISDRFNNAFKAMVEEIKSENLNGWKETDKATAAEMMESLPSFIKK